MKKHKSILFLVCVLVFVVQACNLPSAQPALTPPAGAVDVIATQTSLVLTQEAALGQNPPPVQPEFTATIIQTPMITPTGTLSIPMVSVSVDTNCRTGPGVIYDYLTALSVGEKAEVIGKYTTISPNYWVIKKGSNTCWLWGQYATVEGNINNIPEIVPPPSPTPTATSTATATALPTGPNFSFSYDGISHCSAGDDYAILKWVNSGSVVFESARTEIKDLDAAANLYGPAFSNAPFGAASPGCAAGNSSLGVGNTAYSSYYIGTPAPAGHHIRMTVTLCSQDNLLGDCVTHILDGVLP